MATSSWGNGKALSWLNSMDLVSGRFDFRPWESNVEGVSGMSISLTKKAEEKVKEILSEQPESYAGLRIQVVGGGCSGFQYRMGFDKAFNDQNDSIFEFDGLKVFVD